MKSFARAILSVCLAVAAGAAVAADNMKKSDPMTNKDMTMQECKDHMAMAKKDSMKKDDAMMKKDATCADMMKKDDMMKPGMATSEPMMKK